MMPNWFIGVSVRAEPWFDRLVPPPPEKIRLFHPQDLHITVAFLGDVSEQRAQNAWQHLDWRLESLRVTLGSVVPMGAAHRYSALSALLDQGRQQLEEAITQCRDEVTQAAGVAKETRPAKAHITIARASRTASAQHREQGIRWASNIDLHDCEILLDTIGLYTWATDRKERQFRVVHSRCFS